MCHTVTPKTTVRQGPQGARFSQGLAGMQRPSSLEPAPVRSGTSVMDGNSYMGDADSPGETGGYPPALHRLRFAFLTRARESVSLVLPSAWRTKASPPRRESSVAAIVIPVARIFSDEGSNRFSGPFSAASEEFARPLRFGHGSRSRDVF